MAPKHLPSSILKGGRGVKVCSLSLRELEEWKRFCKDMCFFSTFLLSILKGGVYLLLLLLN